MKLKLGFSTCPNDTFMFDALVHGRIDKGEMDYEVTMADILHLIYTCIRYVVYNKNFNSHIHVIQVT